MHALDCIQQLRQDLRASLGESRLNHSLRVTDLAVAICREHNLDENCGAIAGLAHDMCKELSRREQIRLSRSYRGPGFESEDFKFLENYVPHGPAAAVSLSARYSIHDPEILEAVAFHTTGRPGMCGLTMVIYCADKLEPGRMELSRAFRERVLKLPLMAMVAEVCDSSSEWLIARGAVVAPATQKLSPHFKTGAP